MLVDTRKENTSKEGFSPNVQNSAISAKRTKGQMALWIIVFCFFLGIITIGIAPFAFYMSKKNWFNKMQMKANEATSGIDVQLAQRRDTLVKLVDATRTSMKFEKDLLTEVTKMRSLKINPKNAVVSANQIEAGFGKFIATLERYPEIQSTKTVRDLMASADYQERELAAARRLYNSIANQFNEQLFVWPSCIPASSKKMDLHTLPLFVASAIQRQDVDLKLY